MDITNLLKEKGLTKAEFARRTGILPGNLNGAMKNPTEETIRKFAKTLEVPISRLFEEPAKTKTRGTFICPHCGKRVRLQITED